jgi:hypothetical protein
VEESGEQEEADWCPSYFLYWWGGGVPPVAWQTQFGLMLGCLGDAFCCTDLAVWLVRIGLTACSGVFGVCLVCVGGRERKDRWVRCEVT